LFGFLYDHLGDCIKQSSKSALFYMTPVLVNMFLGFLLSFSKAYLLERAVFYVFINMCNANVTLQLMITNMSNKPYKLIQLAYLYPLIAIGVNQLPGSDAYIC